MYYVVLEWGSYSYVYDTKDSSCEMVLTEMIAGLDLPNKRDNYFPMYKLCSICGIPSFKTYVVRHLVSVDTNVKLNRPVSMAIIRANKKWRERYSLAYEQFGWGTDYFCALSSDGAVSMYNSDILIPPVMFVWLNKMADEHNFNALKDGILDIVIDRRVRLGYDSWREDRWIAF